MILIHGWSCDRSYFAPRFGHFSPSHAVALDLRGHGDSGQPGLLPGSYEIETMASDVLAVAQAASSKSQRRPTP
jgi:pimeloyl-ACP methyl ester carboxylesterase